MHQFDFQVKYKVVNPLLRQYLNMNYDGKIRFIQRSKGPRLHSTLTSHVWIENTPHAIFYASQPGQGRPPCSPVPVPVGVHSVQPKRGEHDDEVRLLPPRARLPSKLKLSVDVLDTHLRCTRKITA